MQPLDTEFITQFAQYDIRHCLPGLRKLAHKTHPEYRFKQLTIVADYSYMVQSALERDIHHEHRPLPGLPSCGVVYSFLTEQELNDSDKKLRAKTVSRKDYLFAILRYLWDANTISVGIPVNIHTRKIHLGRHGRAREALRIERPIRYGAVPKDGPGPPMPETGLNTVQLETVEWDEVDEIWASAQREHEIHNINFWDAVANEAAFVEAGAVRLAPTIYSR